MTGAPGKPQAASASGGFERSERAAKFILERTKLRPKLGLVLGSGLGGMVDDLADATLIPYAEIPDFPRSTVEGHAGTLVVGTLDGVALAAMKGRVHYYEGYSSQEVIFPMRVFRQMGVKAAILTNAAGAINGNFQRGALVTLRDHINLQGTNPLIGPNDARFGPRFPDMTMAYCKRFRGIAQEESKRLDIPFYEGVYAAFSGPSYETPAEIQFLKGIGADVVGMSTVPEVIAARHMGIRVLAISCVTNMAAGIIDGEINHAEVMETGTRVRAQFVRLLRALAPRIAAEIQ